MAEVLCDTAGDGVPHSAMPWVLHEGRDAGEQEGASMAAEPLQRASVHAAREPSCLLTSPQGPVRAFHHSPVYFQVALLQHCHSAGF